MTDSTRHTMILYRRRECSLCDEARQLVQSAFEQRAIRGEPIPILREFDVDGDDELKARYGASVPVLALNGAELGLATSGKQIRTFLDRTLGQLV